MVPIELQLGAGDPCSAVVDKVLGDLAFFGVLKASECCAFSDLALFTFGGVSNSGMRRSGVENAMIDTSRAMAWNKEFLGKMLLRGELKPKQFQFKTKILRSKIRP